MFHNYAASFVGFKLPEILAAMGIYQRGTTVPSINDLRTCLW